ncbi:MAG: SH3 domain-containing protein [Verrucomicrobiaceae bacterium]
MLAGFSAVAANEDHRFSALESATYIGRFASDEVLLELDPSEETEVKGLLKMNGTRYVAKVLAETASAEGAFSDGTNGWPLKLTPSGDGLDVSAGAFTGHLKRLTPKPFVSRFVSGTDSPQKIVIEFDSGGTTQRGTLSLGDQGLPFTGVVTDDTLQGTFTNDGEEYPFSVTRGKDVRSIEFKTGAFTTTLTCGIIYVVTPDSLIRLRAQMGVVDAARSRPSAQDDSYTVTGIADDDMLNIRSGPGKDYPIVAQLANGTGQVRITGESVMNGDADWVPIQFAGGKGWVRPKFLVAKRADASSHKVVDSSPAKELPTNLLKNGDFQQRMARWGTGKYEPRDELAWGAARASYKLDHDTAHNESPSFTIENRSPRSEHVYRTMSQRITGLRPHSTYRVVVWAKARNLANDAVFITTDLAWNDRIRLGSGTYDWTPFTQNITTQNASFIDFRIVMEDTGTIWLDDLGLYELGR